MAYLIECMTALDKMNNFFDSSSILGGFDSNPMHRLNLHFSLLSSDHKKVLDDLRQKFDPSGNFNELRDAQKTVANQNQPIVPYLGMFLSDLFKYDDAIALYVDGLINVKKMQRVYELISTILSYSRFHYNFLSVDQVQLKIDQFVDIDEDKLFDMSYEVEPEGAQSETDLKDGQ